MHRKLALVLMTFGLAAPSAVLVAVQPASAATRTTHADSVGAPHSERTHHDSSLDKTSHESKRTETLDTHSNDTHPSSDTNSNDSPTKDPTTDR